MSRKLLVYFGNSLQLPHHFTLFLVFRYTFKFRFKFKFFSENLGICVYTWHAANMAPDNTKAFQLVLDLTWACISYLLFPWFSLAEAQRPLLFFFFFFTETVKFTYFHLSLCLFSVRMFALATEI